MSDKGPVESDFEAAMMIQEDCKLPVARCGDCLYCAWVIPGTLRAPEASSGYFVCARKHSNGEQVDIKEGWCGEFIHRKLGGQNVMVWLNMKGDRVEYDPNPKETIMQKECKQWRFPTEEE